MQPDQGKGRLFKKTFVALHKTMRAFIEQLKSVESNPETLKNSVEMFVVYNIQTLEKMGFSKNDIAWSLRNIKHGLPPEDVAIYGPHLNPVPNL
jgi:Holliday junction resolvasome RuvABC DNA-binding subunit